MTKTIARAFAEYCTDLSIGDPDSDDVEYTKKLLMDTIGTAVGGYDWSDSADVMLGTARALDGGTSIAGESESGARHAYSESGATVLATGERLAPENAALANGALSHSLDYDNRHSPGSLHIGSSVIPAALAAAEEVNADGETLLAGIFAGYDVAARLGMACNPRSSHERGFHPTGTCGTFAATAAAGVVAGLETDELVTAFGVNGSQASGGYQCSISGGWNKRLHPGLAARGAFLAVAAAQNGFEAPTNPIEGELGFLQAYADRPLPERATEGLGEVYEATRTKIKPYPVGTFAHVPISLLLEIAVEHDLDPNDVKQVVVEMPTSGAEMFGRDPADDHPTTSAGAQFDTPFAVALALTRRKARLADFDDALSDSYRGAFGRLMDVTQTIGSDELEDYLPELYPARITVRTETDEHERFREWVRGEPSHPMTWDDLEEKLTDLTPRFDDADRETIIDVIQSIENGSAAALIGSIRSAAK
jgi:2-methylcitrate dehydratase PrpD